MSETTTTSPETPPVAGTTPAAATTTTPASPGSSTTPPTGQEQAKGAPSQTEAKSLLSEKAAPEGAPEAYKDFTVPEGFTLDGEVSKEAAGMFKEMNLSQEQAQKLVDFYVGKTKEAYESPFNAYVEMREKWQGEIKADKEIGPKLAQVKTTVSKAIDQLGPDLAAGFREAMDFTGVGDHPAFVKAFFKFAQMLTEGTHVSGTGPSRQGQAAPGAGQQTAARALYPNNP